MDLTQFFSPFIVLFLVYLFCVSIGMEMVDLLGVMTGWLIYDANLYFSLCNDDGC